MIDRAPPTVTVTEIEEGRVMEAGGVTVSAFLVEHDPGGPPSATTSRAEGAAS